MNKPNLLDLIPTALEISSREKLDCRPWLIDGYIRKGDVCIIYTASDIDTTPWIITLSLELTRNGIIYDTLDCPLPGNVYYYEGVTPHTEFENKIAMLYQGDYEFDLRLVSMKDLKKKQNSQSQDPYHLSDNIFQDELLELISSGDTASIILDDIASLFAKASESPADMTKMTIPWIKKMQAKEITQFWVIPEGKYANVIPNHLIDFAMKLSPVPMTATPTMVFEIVKCRHTSFEVRKVFLELLTQEDGRLTVQKTVSPDHNFISAVLLASQGRTQVEISQFLGISQSTVSRLIKRAELHCLLVKDGHQVILTEAGQKALYKAAT